jgi:hypothetical protein
MWKGEDAGNIVNTAMHQQNNSGQQIEKEDGAEIETAVELVSRLANAPVLISISIPVLFLFVICFYCLKTKTKKKVSLHILSKHVCECRIVGGGG